jgi:hypothetical protein
MSREEMIKELVDIFKEDFKSGKVLNLEILLDSIGTNHLEAFLQCVKELKS